ncbi:hypothetical protein SEA_LEEROYJENKINS_126 [Microbacterium phage LeeroyJenkins]|nr:hypothetical protein SEA_LEEROYJENKINS_126 [Microbacterium phage LeeroyJenkins]
MNCSCAINRDGSRTTILCPVHSEVDPCERYSRVTGKRRKGTIKSGKCTHCGWEKSIRRNSRVQK